MQRMELKSTEAMDKYLLDNIPNFVISVCLLQHKIYFLFRRAEMPRKNRLKVDLSLLEEMDVMLRMGLLEEMGGVQRMELKSTEAMDKYLLDNIPNFVISVCLLQHKIYFLFRRAEMPRKNRLKVDLSHMISFMLMISFTLKCKMRSSGTRYSLVSCLRRFIALIVCCRKPSEKLVLDRVL